MHVRGRTELAKMSVIMIENKEKICKHCVFFKIPCMSKQGEDEHYYRICMYIYRGGQMIPGALTVSARPKLIPKRPTYFLTFIVALRKHPGKLSWTRKSNKLKWLVMGR